MKPITSSVYPVGTSPNGHNVTLIAPAETLQRLSERCFRGTHVLLAGNFMRWNGFHDFMRSDVRFDLIDEIMERVGLHEKAEAWKRRFDERVEIECEYVVGWASTERLDRLDRRVLEPFSLNARATGLRVRLDARVVAPQTFYMTIVYTLRFRPETGDWQAFLNSMYPGKDVGPLGLESGGKGPVDITEREGVAFFDFQNPGFITHEFRGRKKQRPLRQQRQPASNHPRLRRNAA